jgi:thiol-disulfide isomerase/thioredoxin
MAKDISKFMMKIEDDAAWDSIIEASETKVVVVDIHQEWCGHCEAILPSMSRVLLEYDNAEERFIYAAASIGKVGAKIQAAIPAESHINLEKNGCLPLFAVFRVIFLLYSF